MAMDTPRANDAIKKLLLKKKRDAHGASTVDTAFVFEPTPVERKKPRPEERIPDIPQNAAVRDYVKRAAPGAIPLGKEMTLSQCWRCKLFGHATGSRECPYFLSGNIELEAERHVREDPLPSKAIDPNVSDARKEKLSQLRELLSSVESAEAERKMLKKEKSKKKKKKKKKKEKKKKTMKQTKEQSESSKDDLFAATAT